MKVSVNWLKKYTEITADINDLVEKIGAQLGGVDEVINVGEKYKDALVVKVVECEKHTGADKLSVCLIDDGGKTKDINRNSAGLIQVVCGAPNVKAGMMVAWLPPKSVVPATFDKDPFVLESREIRGEMSNGMLASAKELAIGDSHEGILEIDKPANPGDSFSKLYELDDYVIDIENKMFTHRPDCFGMLGVAREIAGIYGKKFTSPDWYLEPLKLVEGSDIKLEVKNEIPDLAPRFMAVAISGVEIKPSDIQMQSYLSRVGIRPINNIVDLTNLGMIITGQPLHAYDADKVGSNVLGVRKSKKGDEVKLLNGKTLKLNDGAMVIADGEKPIGLAGIMGGADTEVDENTKNIILECANFDMYAVRRASMEYGIFTDASTRFAKGQSPLQNDRVISKFADHVIEAAGGKISSKIVDDNNSKPVKFDSNVDTKFVSDLLGANLTTEEINKLLGNVEFEIKASENGNEITKIPFWRTDIEIAEDIVEEVGRLYGYDKLPKVLPQREMSATKIDDQVLLKSKLRNVLSAAGANEVLTYSFVPSDLLEKAGQDKKQTYHIRNALSPDLQYYRMSLTPSLLEKVHSNIKQGFDKFVLYEFGKVHARGVEDEDGIPLGRDRLAMVFADKSKQKSSAYFDLKFYVENLKNILGIQVLDYLPFDEKEIKSESAEWKQAFQGYEPKRSALIFSGEYFVGVIGEPSAELKQGLKLPNSSAMAELDMEILQDLSGKLSSYAPLNKYPSIEQDVCFVLEDKDDYRSASNEIELFLSTNQHGYGYNVSPLDIYKKVDDPSHKQITWRIELWHPEKTLTTDEVNDLVTKLAKQMSAAFDAKLI